MARVAVVTDSTSDLPESIIGRLGIRVVPLNVHFGQEVFKDQVDIFPEEFYHRLAESSAIPRTSQPSPGDFVMAYEAALASGAETVISIHVSGAMSGTIGSAHLARTMLPGADIRILDSRTVSLAMGLLVIDAATMAADGADAARIIEHVSDRSTRVRLLCVLNTLEYLHRNGRIGRAASLVGSLLSIKPILAVVDGVIAPFERTRGRAKAVAHMLQAARAELVRRPPERAIGVVHALCEAEARELRSALLDVGGGAEIILSEIGAVVGVHAGPWAVGIVY